MIYLVTPCRNAAETIDRTITSIVSQAGDFSVRYHVQDGGSQDGTIEKLEWWKRKLSEPNYFGRNKLTFSYAVETDRGMYDALVRGFACLEARPNDFIGWINADDILMPGALMLAETIARQFLPEQVSWFGGAVAILRNDIIIATHDRPIPTEVVRFGLCEGQHWDFIQQEGTFFRRWLWDAVMPDVNLAPMKFAGDWNLWRLFAEHAPLAQWGSPTGAFCIRKGQVSEDRAAYMAEIDLITPAEVRRRLFAAVLDRGTVTRRRILQSGDRRLVVHEQCVDNYAEKRFVSVFGSSPVWGRPSAADKSLFGGSEEMQTDEPENSQSSPARSKKTNLIAFDSGWQFPAITEEHAFRKISSLSELPDGVVYVAYPWAMLIDKLQCEAFDANRHLRSFSEFCKSIPEVGIKLTVCQHVLLKNYMHLFREAGISVIFWSHATLADVKPQQEGQIAIKPFPLFPVQISEPSSDVHGGEKTSRPYLFSFIGARSDEFYLKPTRDQIIDLLKDDPRGLIIGRDGWHR